MRKTALLLSLLAAATPAAAEMVPAGDAARGEKVYAATCAACHASVSRTVRQIDGATPAEKQAWLERFLAGHHAVDPAARADVIAYLLSR